jgi:hypothetical protein
MAIFTYWQSVGGNAIPSYLELCRQTWQQCVQDREIVIINHNNIRQFLPAKLLTDNFFALPLAIQSDVVSVYMLAKHGGLFLDTDTIMINKGRLNFGDKDKLTAFGYPEKKSIHLAVLACHGADNPLLKAWLEVIMFRLSQPLPDPLPWDYLGNAIIGVLMQSGLFDEQYEIIDAIKSGNILEASTPGADTCQRYLNYYFKPNENLIFDFESDVEYGLISLHNSWTPEVYKKLSPESLCQSTEICLLSRLLLNTIDYNKNS